MILRKSGIHKQLNSAGPIGRRAHKSTVGVCYICILYRIAWNVNFPAETFTQWRRRESSYVHSLLFYFPAAAHAFSVVSRIGLSYCWTGNYPHCVLIHNTVLGMSWEIWCAMADYFFEILIFVAGLCVDDVTIC